MYIFYIDMQLPVTRGKERLPDCTEGSPLPNDALILVIRGYSFGGIQL